MLPLYAAITGGLLAWYRSRQLKKEVKDVPWAKKAYETLYDAEDDWKYNLQPQSILQSALGYGVGPELYYARADTHAYTMAYNEGHRDARNQSGYKPDKISRLDKVAFRDAYKLRAESEIVSRKKKGKVISMIGSDPRLRKLKKDKDITKLPDKYQKSLDEFNGAVVWKEPKGIVDKVMVREMAIQQLRLSDAILELEQYIRLGMISEEDAFRKIVAMSQ
jgi:hypothetical protein